MSVLGFFSPFICSNTHTRSVFCCTIVVWFIVVQLFFAMQSSLLEGGHIKPEKIGIFFLIQKKTDFLKVRFSVAFFKKKSRKQF